MTTTLPRTAGDVLAEIKTRTVEAQALTALAKQHWATIRAVRESAADVPRLVAALEAVLAVVDDLGGTDVDALDPVALYEDLTGAIDRVLLGGAA